MVTVDFVAPHAESSTMSGQHRNVSVYAKRREDYNEFLIEDILWLLDGHINVVEPKEIFSFDENVTPTAKLQKKCDAFVRKLDKLNIQTCKENEMYPFLQRAFKSALPPSQTDADPLRCIDISSVRPATAHDAGGSIKQCPDLALTFNRDTLKHPQKLFHHPAVFVEVKSSSAFDPSFLPTRQENKLFKTRPTKNQQHLLFQILSYVVIAQYPMLPWEYVYLITVTGPVARIWKFSPVGCQVTTQIRYTTDPIDLIRFLHFIARGGSRAMGLGVGNDAIFQDYDPDDDDEKELLETVANVYSVSSGDQKWDQEPKKLSGYWAMAIPSKDLFPPPPPTADSTTQGTTGSAEPLRLVIFRNPIHHATSLFSRGTRCYLAINRDFIDSHKPSKDKPTNETVIQAMRMVKTAWQYDARHHEGDFFRLYRERNKGTIQCGIPTLLASGRGVSQQAIKVDYGTPEEKEEERVPTEEVGEIEPYHGLDHLVANLNEILHYPPTVTPYSNKEVSTQGASGDRTFHWLLFKEVGAKLENARGSKEFLRVLMDVLDAHKSFYDARILHRDISGNNILIKLSTEPGPRRGLLIDWDMAKDLDETRLHQHPMMTGTLPYMSVALKHNPRHQYWHDIESLFWVWVFYSVRHMEGISLDGSLMRNREARATKLDKYFPASGLERLCQAKRSFLSIGSLDVANCPFYQDACDLVQMSFMKLYRVLEDICRLVNAIESYRKARGLSLVSETKPETSPGPYGIITTSDILKILEPLENLAEKDSRLLSKFRSIQTSLKGLVIPDHSSVHDELNKAYEVNEDAQWLPFDPPDKGHNLIGRLKEVSQSESQRATPNPLPTSSRRGDDSIADQTSGQESREYLYKDPKPGKRKHGGRTETLKGTSSGSNKRQKRAK